jgi:methyl-accepting chemotaxis protein
MATLIQKWLDAVSRRIEIRLLGALALQAGLTVVVFWMYLLRVPVDSSGQFGLSLIVGGAAIVAVAVVAVWAVMSVVAPLGRLERHVTAVARSGILTPCVEADRSDEIGTIATGLNCLSAEFHQMMGSTRRAVTAMAANDLSARITFDARGDFAMAAGGVNHSLDNLSDSMRSVIGNIRNVAAVAGEASSVIGQIADGAQFHLITVKDGLPANSTSHTEAGMMRAVDSLAGNVRQITHITDVISRIVARTNADMVPFRF